MSKLILKAELIERMKAGETLTRFHEWDKPDSFYMATDMKNVHRAAAMSLIKAKQVKLIKRDYASAKYVWNGRAEDNA